MLCAKRWVLIRKVSRLTIIWFFHSINHNTLNTSIFCNHDINVVIWSNEMRNVAFRVQDDRLEKIGALGGKLLGAGGELEFARGEVVLCLDPESGAVAKGLVNYSSDETEKILGCATRDIEGRLGFVREPELMHRDNLVLV